MKEDSSYISYLLSLQVEKEMSTHSSTLAWKIPRTEEPGRLQSVGLKESDMTGLLHYHYKTAWQRTKASEKHNIYHW